MFVACSCKNPKKKFKRYNTNYQVDVDIVELLKLMWKHYPPLKVCSDYKYNNIDSLLLQFDDAVFIAFMMYIKKYINYKPLLDFIDQKCLIRQELLLFRGDIHLNTILLTVPKNLVGEFTTLFKELFCKK